MPETGAVFQEKPVTRCILGGGGPFGETLAAHLLATTDANVLSIGRSPLKPEAYRLHGDSERFIYRQIQMGRATWLSEIMWLLEDVQPEYVVNFAALAAPIWENSHLYYRTNVVALAELTEWLLTQSWLKHWVQIGSSEVYGSCDLPVCEDQPPNPTTPYAVSKVAADMHLLALHRRMGFPVTILRPSNCYGPGQPPYRVIPRAILAALTGGTLPLQGGGRAAKSYMHARDLARAIQLATEAPARGEIYHLGPLEATEIRHLVRMVAEVCDVPYSRLVEEVPDRIGQDARYLLDSSKFREAFRWAPAINLMAGLRDTAEWVRANLDFLLAQPTEYVLRP